MQMLVKILDNQTINKRKINNKNNKKEKGNYIINFFGESKNVKITLIKMTMIFLALHITPK
jgi:hypothetical protein